MNATRFPVYSLSRLSTFMDCPFRGYGQYILKLRFEKTPVYFAFGKGLEDAIYQHLHNPSVPFDDLHFSAAVEFYREYGEDREKWDEEVREKFDQIKPALETALKEAVPVLKDRWESIQKQFYIPVGRAEFTGIIDLEMKDGSLVDIKTSSRSWAKGKELAEEQPPVYSLWPFSCDDSLKEVTFLYCIIVLTKTPKFDLREVKIRRDEAMAYMDLLSSRIELVESLLERYERTEDPKVFPANRQSWTCSRKSCPVWQECEKTWGWTIKE